LAAAGNAEGGAVESAALSAAEGSISSSRWRGPAHGAGHINAGAVPQDSDWTIRSAATCSEKGALVRKARGAAITATDRPFIEAKGSSAASG
jgi:hypothetical protein